MKSTLKIKDLSATKELNREELASVRGGQVAGASYTSADVEYAVDLSVAGMHDAMYSLSGGLTF